MAINIPNNDSVLKELSAVVGGVLANKMASEQAMNQREHEAKVSREQNEHQLKVVQQTYENNVKLMTEQRDQMLKALPQQLQAWGLDMTSMLPEEAEKTSAFGHYGSRAAIGATAGAALGMMGGPAAPITVPIGATVGGGMGLLEGALAHLWGSTGDRPTDRKRDIKQKDSIAKLQSIAALNQLVQSMFAPQQTMLPPQ